jgi:hypothetical protein
MGSPLCRWAPIKNMAVLKLKFFRYVDHRVKSVSVEAYRVERAKRRAREDADVPEMQLRNGHCSPR